VEWNFNVLSSQTVPGTAGKTDIPADLVIGNIDHNKESRCRMVPRVKIANLHDSIPPEFLVYLLKYLPDLLGEPFPPEVQPDHNPTEPPERAAPEKISSPSM
jgi:hypothetical protein